MADCDLCGTAKPTLCPVKVQDPRVKVEYPNGTWRGLDEKCLNSCHEANLNRIEAKAKKCALCYAKDRPLFWVDITIPTFEKPYSRVVKKPICDSCLDACEEALKRKNEGE